MITIYKYPIPIDGRFSLILPAGADILAVQVQDMQPCLWAKVDTDAPQQRYQFHLYGTGYLIDPADDPHLKHVGTFQMGRFVWHLFVVGIVAIPDRE